MLFKGHSTYDECFANSPPAATTPAFFRGATLRVELRRVAARLRRGLAAPTGSNL